MDGCNVYLDAPLDRPAVVAWIARTQPDARATGRAVESPDLIITVAGIPEADPVLAAAPDGFVHYPYLLEVEPGEVADRERFVGAVGALLGRLWAAGWRAVAAGPFDAELPLGGGFDGERLTCLDVTG